MIIVNQFFYKITSILLLNLAHGNAMIGNNIRDAKINEFPFVVSIGPRTYDDVVCHIEKIQFGAGTLITRRHVLTAEHCLLDEEIDDIEIIIGSVNLREGKKYLAKTWITYQDWKKIGGTQSSSHDIAIIMLSKQVTDVRPAKMLLNVPFSRPGARVKIAGWGEQNDGKKSAMLKTADLKIIPLIECETKIRDLSDDEFFFNSQDICTQADPWTLIRCGDSGGPLMNEMNHLVGINVAYCPLEMKSNHSKEFVYANQVNIHVSIYYYGTFIKHVTKGYLKYL